MYNICIANERERESEASSLKIWKSAQTTIDEYLDVKWTALFHPSFSFEYKICTTHKTIEKPHTHVYQASKSSLTPLYIYSVNRIPRLSLCRAAAYARDRNYPRAPAIRAYPGFRPSRFRSSFPRRNNVGKFYSHRDTRGSLSVSIWRNLFFVLSRRLCARANLNVKFCVDCSYRAPAAMDFFMLRWVEMKNFWWSFCVAREGPRF